jgi:hypothetical protein
VPTVQANDLVFEAAHIGSEGPAMTHSMLAIGEWAINRLNRLVGRAGEWTPSELVWIYTYSHLSLPCYALGTLSPGWLALASHKHAGATDGGATGAGSSVDHLSAKAAVDPSAKAAAEFEASYKTNVAGPFRLWLECPIPPDMCQGMVYNSLKMVYGEHCAD